jgi:DNA invertase Pin-like site-specific DNA recombinase
MDLHNFNPWWKSDKVSPEFTGRKRKIFDEIGSYIDKRQIVLFTGLRRVGRQPSCTRSSTDFSRKM